MKTKSWGLSIGWFYALVFLSSPELILRGATWVQTSAPVTNWLSIACSADASTIAAGTANGPLIISTNSGVSWFEAAHVSHGWYSIASSADGKILAAVAGASVYVSTNGGVSWLLSPTPGPVQTPIAISADGARIAGFFSHFYYGATNYLSTNSGRSWTYKRLLPGWSIACSAAGTTLAYADSTIDISKDFGDTWQSFDPPGVRYQQVVLSADASVVMATGRLMWDYFVYFSTNNGLNWTKAELPAGIWRAACSADGRKMVANGTDDGVQEWFYMSTNSGGTWAKRFSVTNSVGFCLSADGNTMAVARVNGGIHIFRDDPEPSLNIKSTITEATISWIVPSVECQLEQSPSPTGPSWQRIDTAPVLNYSNLQHEVRVPLGSGPMYYRLAK